MDPPDTVDFFDKQPVFGYPIKEILNYDQQVICEYRKITDNPNLKRRRFSYPKCANESPQLRQLKEARDELAASKVKLRLLAESFRKLTAEVRQNKKSQDNFQKSVEVDRKFSQMVQV
jgi:hypothetical protein